MSNSIKLVLLVCVIAVLMVAISIGGPKAVNAIQMHFGNKGKVDLIERCIEMPGCSIGPSDLDFYERYKTVRGSEAAQKIRESEAVEKLIEE
jgi:hypothetical protein